METKLYNHLVKNLLDKDIISSNIEHQKQIENSIWARDNSLWLDDKYIKNIIKYLKIYNSFLKESWKKEVSLRYYQILALYFTELFFDKQWEIEMDDFSKNALAYWMATWSWKTIVMHLNILQYLDKIKNFSKLQIILTTPWVNLIDQHKEEIEPFIDYLNKNKYSNKIDFIINTTSSLLNKWANYYSLNWNKKLKRLILIDEAHIWTSSSDEWKFHTFRNELNKENSFLFEYSATYHNLNTTLAKEYENQIVYDYNYNLFYKDWYWKDFSFKQVWNDILAWESESELKKNLDNCLSVISEKINIWSNLADYNSSQQKALFGNIKMFPDKPLITFMWNTVNNKDKKNDDPEISDISNIIKYLSNLNDGEKKQFKKVFNHKINWKLTITRTKSIGDELLLSYWDNGKYFWIINVWSWDKFFNSIDFKNVDKKNIEIIDNKYLFKNIDRKDSPINILIWSRKFAEWWNSFRVSVIALINLWSNAWNKIIQIFGRWVRLKGLNWDWKRKYLKHEKDYFDLTNSDDDNLKRLETLNVLSVKKSYLETFTKKVNEEIKFPYSFKIKVDINLINLSNWENIEFEQYKKYLPIFKLSKKEIDYKNVVLKDNLMLYSYFDKDIIVDNEKVSDFNFNLDYRTNKANWGICIKKDLKAKLELFNDYIDVNYTNNIIQEYLNDNKINLYSITDDSIVDFSYNDIFNFIWEIKYDINISNDLKRLEKILNVIVSDFLKKIKNKVNHKINSKNIVYNQELSQKSKDNNKGDFIEEYTITKEFKTEKERIEYIENIEIKRREILNALKLDFNKHIYSPLLIESNEELDISISPDKLNTWEKIFVEELKEYIDVNYTESYLNFYLMRNVESLRAIWIYLEEDEHPFFPDFILWIIDEKNKKTYINFIDPKWQDWILDRETFSFNEKATIWNKENNNTLYNIEEQLNIKSKNQIILNSFILLKSWSDLWVTNKDNIQEKMLENNILKIDWSWSILCNYEKYENKSYLDIFFEKIIWIQK